MGSSRGLSPLSTLPRGFPATFSTLVFFGLMDEEGTRESVLPRGPPPSRPPRRPGWWPRLVAPGTRRDHGTLVPPARLARARGRFVQEMHHAPVHERLPRCGSPHIH